MIKKINISGIDYKVNVWKIKDELNVLYQFMDLYELPLEDQINNVADILIPETKDLDYISRLYIMVLLSSYANGDSIDLLMTCPHCNNPIDTAIEIRDNLKFTPLNAVEVIINGEKHNITKSNLHLCDQLPLKDYNNIISKLSNGDGGLKLNATVKCIMCENNVEIETELVDLFSDYVIRLDLENYYKLLKYFIHELRFNKTDFDNLYPFEIQILLKKDDDE